MMKKTAAWFMFFVFAVMPIYGSHADASCESPDNLNSVSGTAHCLAIKTHSPPSGSTKTLVVVLHGDLSRGGDADYIIPVAGRAAYGAIGVAMARPGYTLDRRTSSGVATREQSRSDRFTAYEINSIAAAVATLKKHHGAKRVVMVGHSGGAVVSGVMLGSSGWWMSLSSFPVHATCQGGATPMAGNRLRTQSLQSTIFPMHRNHRKSLR